MVAYLFAGQGSQYVGMGKDLCESFPASKAIFDKADQVLGFSLTKLCFQGPEEELKKTNNSQPAILTMSIAAYEAYKSTVCGLQSSVSYVAGLSLGEYSALVASGAISFEDAVYLVRRRGEFMEDQALKNPGKMLSIVGLDLDQVKKICQETKTEVANINCPGQTVISGGPKEIEEAKVQAEKLGAKMAVILEVSGAFHSSFMQGATIKLAQELEKIKVNTPKIPVICNVTAKPTFSAQEIKDNLIKQVASSVLWENSMRFAIAQGVTNFVEFGPGKVLRGLLRRIDSNVKAINIEKKQDLESVVSV